MYSQLSQSPFPTGNFVVIRLPSGFASFHRVDDDIFADNSFEGISRRQTSRIPFTLFCLIVSKEVLVDCVARFGTLEDAELHKNKIQPPQTVFYPDPPSLPAPSSFHGTSPLVSSGAQSIESVSPAETVSPDELKKLFSIVESVAAGQTEILNLLTEQANRMTNMEGAISLCNERILKASTDMMAMKAAEAAAAQSTIMRKPVNPSDPPQAISLVPYMELQEQIDAFIESAEGKALDVSINGKSFAMDAHLVRAAQHVKKPRDFAAVIFQMVLDVSHLKDYSIGYLDTGRVAGISKRQNGGPKTLFSEDFNRFLGNLCMLCGGCVVHETTLRVWWSEVRYGLNSKGDNIFAGSSLTSPDLHYMRPGSVHLPVFSDPKVFAAPPARKRRFVVNESAASVEELG